MTTTLFDVTGPLPTGTTVLEASAGTGKTYAIAALAIRALAEGVADIDDLLLITFSRAATAELRTRVRERMKETIAALRGAAAGIAPDDAVAAHLAATDADELALRTRRLESAFARFDRASIMTTHEFCHGMLAGLGILAPQTPQSTLVEDLRPLAEEVAEDTYLRLFADAPDGAPFPFERVWDADPAARQIAENAVQEVADLIGAGTPGAGGARVAFAEAVRDEVARRKDARRLFSFDDQLTRLDAALADPVTGAQARARLAARFPVVLVDEFQDTDPTQWSVLRQAFSGAATLVLIGDPKQAIYGFRGGDVHTYGLAVDQADATTTLGVNHRSDPEVVAGVSWLFRGVKLGDAITVPPVTTANAPRLIGTPGTAWESGVQVRALDADEPVRGSTARRAITRDVVAVVAELLAPDPPLHRVEGGAALRPSEIAVLVRSNERGQELADALAKAGVPATFNGTTSVLGGEAAADWLTLLRALDQPRRPFLQQAFVTDFIGASVRDVALADADQLASWSLLVHSWARVLQRHGVPALFAAFDADTDFRARLLTRPGGERLVTDHRHLAELLHRQVDPGRAGRARDLAAWLSGGRQGAETGADTTRRRDTDADAVEVMTIHRAKGLQWPVVLLPEASHDRRVSTDTGRPLVLPQGDRRILDVAGRSSPGRAARWDRWLAEEADESLRALYVGLTRAQSRVVTWWAHHEHVAAAPLHRLLHARHDPEQPARPELAYDPEELPAGGSPVGLAHLAGSPVACVPVRATAEPAASGRSSLPAASSLGVRPWQRRIDQQWRRTSYTGLTAAAHEFASPLEDPLVTDEPGVEVEAPGDSAWNQPSPMADLPAGAAFGTLVHAVYEHTDAGEDAWRAALARAVAEALRRWPLGGVEADALAVALEPSFTTDLGRLAPGLTLRDVAPADRLSEMDFEFALDHPEATLADIAALLAEHLPPDDPLASYPARLDHPGLADQTLRGFLTGSIDSVLRLRSGERTDGFLVVDYKTNRLSAPDDPLTLGHYTPAAMAEAMMASHYPLQALLYCVALHRFLRQRMAGYDPDRHLAGVLYLFVRGMGGPDAPVVDGDPLGVFSWRPPTALVLATSRLLAGGPR